MISEKGIEFLKKHEGCKLTAYRDSGGVLTIGYGHTGDDVYEGLVIDEPEAERLLRTDLLTAEDCVDSYVEVELTADQYDALVSLVYNIGCHAFQNSTLLKLLNGGDYEAAKAQFARWNKVNSKVVQGLVNRRKDEAELFLA